MELKSMCCKAHRLTKRDLVNTTAKAATKTDALAQMQKKSEQIGLKIIGMEPAMLVSKYVSKLSSPFPPYLPCAGETLSSFILLPSSFAAFILISLIFSAQNHEKRRTGNLILLNLVLKLFAFSVWAVSSGVQSKDLYNTEKSNWSYTLKQRICLLFRAFAKPHNKGIKGIKKCIKSRGWHN